jgi:hypothetical protein
MSIYYRTLLNANPIISIVNYAISQGWTIPSTSTIAAMNTYINSLQTSGLWERYDIFYNFGYNNASLYNFSTINWKSPGLFNITYNGSFLSSNYDAQGLLGTYDGSYVGMKFNTGFIPATHSVNYQLNNANLTSISAVGSPINFSYNAAYYNSTIIRARWVALSKAGSAAGDYYGINNSNYNNQPGDLATGFSRTFDIMCRTNSSQIFTYNDIFGNNTFPSPSTSLATDQIGLVTTNINTAGNITSLSLFGAGSSMDNTDFTILNTITSTFRTSIGL